MRTCAYAQFLKYAQIRCQHGEVDETEPWRLLGRRLREARQLVGLSKRQAAARAGFSEGLWRQLELGYRVPAPGVIVPPRPRDDTLVAAARAVQLDPGEVFELVGREYDIAGVDDRAVDEVAALAARYRRLDPAAQAVVDALITELLKRQR